MHSMHNDMGLHQLAAAGHVAPVIHPGPDDDVDCQSTFVRASLKYCRLRSTITNTAQSLGSRSIGRSSSSSTNSWLSQHQQQQQQMVEKPVRC